MREAIIYLLKKEKEKVIACRDVYGGQANQKGRDDCEKEVAKIDELIVLQNACRTKNPLFNNP